MQSALAPFCLLGAHLALGLSVGCNRRFVPERCHLRCTLAASRRWNCRCATRDGGQTGQVKGARRPRCASQVKSVTSSQSTTRHLGKSRRANSRQQAQTTADSESYRLRAPTVSLVTPFSRVSRRRPRRSQSPYVYLYLDLCAGLGGVRPQSAEQVSERQVRHDGHGEVEGGCK